MSLIKGSISLSNVNLRPEEINSLLYGSADQRTGNVVIELKAGIISHLSIKVNLSFFGLKLTPFIVEHA